MDKSRNERYSPPWLVEAAREVMGAVDIDPASCPLANTTVGASRYYTRESNGLKQRWYGRVFLNPPYGYGIKLWLEKLGREVAAGRVQQAFVVAPGEILCAMAAPWFAVLLRGSILVPYERIEFTDPAHGKAAGPRYGAFVSYLGKNQLRFARVLGSKGTVLRPATVPTMYEGRTCGRLSFLAQGFLIGSNDANNGGQMDAGRATPIRPAVAIEWER
jgi:ParB family chromosome partitioning protein